MQLTSNDKVNTGMLVVHTIVVYSLPRHSRSNGFVVF